MFIAPTAYALVWFSVMGGIGLRQSRQALELEKLGTDFYGDAAHFQTAKSTFCYDVPQEDVVLDGDVIFTNSLKGITPVCQFDSSNSDMGKFIINITHMISSFEILSNFAISIDQHGST